jgi:hypothetical protein
LRGELLEVAGLDSVDPTCFVAMSVNSGPDELLVMGEIETYLG